MPQVFHTLPPVFDGRSRVLILGSIPSPRSRAEGFYYGHPQNRFWPVLAGLFRVPLPKTPEEKKALVLARGVALWDVLARCDIEGASDQSIRDPLPNDLSVIFRVSPIRAVFTTGGAASRLLRRYCPPPPGMEHIPLPSTSPANCKMSMEELSARYGRILDFLP